MPLYEYGCKACEHTWTDVTKIADRLAPTEAPCQECGGEVTLLIGAPNIVDPVRIGVTRPSSEFQEVIQRIHEKTPGSKLNQKYSTAGTSDTGATDPRAQKAAKKFIKKVNNE